MKNPDICRSSFLVTKKPKILLDQIFALSGNANTGKKYYLHQMSLIINLFIEDFIQKGVAEFGKYESELFKSDVIHDILEQERIKLARHIEKTYS